MDPDAALVAALDRIAERLDRIEARLAPLETAARGGVAAAGIATDSFDRLAAEVGEEEVDARLRAARDTLVKLSEPATLQALRELAEFAPRLVTLVREAPGALAMLVDTLDGYAARAQDRGIDLDQRGRVLLDALERLTSPSALATLDAVFTRIDTIEHLLRSRVLDPHSVDVVSQAADALTASRGQPVPPVGFFGLLGAMGEPEVQRAAGFAIQFARAFGQRLPSQ